MVSRLPVVLHSLEQGTWKPQVPRSASPDVAALLSHSWLGTGEHLAGSAATRTILPAHMGSLRFVVPLGSEESQLHLPGIRICQTLSTRKSPVLFHENTVATWVPQERKPENLFYAEGVMLSAHFPSFSPLPRFILHPRDFTIRNHFRQWNFL